MTILLRAAALFFAFALTLAAPSLRAQTTLEFPTWQAEEPGVSTWWKELIAAYEKRYPDVKIDMQQVPFAQLDCMLDYGMVWTFPEIVKAD